MKPALVLSLLLSAVLCLPGCARAGKTAYPAPIRALQAQGINIRGTMPAPAGFKGYIGEFHGQPMPVYLLPDGKHTMVGNLFDANGKDLTGRAFAERVHAGLDRDTWTQLGKATWFAEGSAHAKRVVYVFTDTECPYCHRLWQAIRPQVRKGEVQVRYLLVAVISPESLPRAAAVLDANDPLAAYDRNERNFDKHRIKPAARIPAATRKKIADNISLMDGLGIQGTPGIVYKDAKGKVRIIAGLPQPDGIRAVFGP